MIVWFFFTQETWHLSAEVTGVCLLEFHLANCAALARGRLQTRFNAKSCPAENSPRLVDGKTPTLACIKLCNNHVSRDIIGRIMY